MGTHDEARLDTKFIDFARQMNLYLNHFPKHEKQPILARKLFLMRYMELTGGMSAVPCKDLVTDWAAA